MRRFPREWFTGRRAWPASATAAAAHAETTGTYNFLIDPHTSGLSAPITAGVQTSGTLIGDYSDTNTTGTRTKPGLFGSFGATENLPVPIQLNSQMSGTVNTDTAGGFLLDVDSPSGSVVMRQYAANFLSGGPVDLPITVTLQTDSFRTRNPTSTYPGGVPVTLPIGQASLTALSIQQVLDGPGTLTQTGPNTYDFTVVPIVQLTMSFTFLGNTFDVPGTPTPLPLTGSLVFSGNTAVLTSVRPVDISQTAMPGQALPQFPLALPTILPPGSTANTLLDLTLSEISASITGTLTTRADGVLVPAPAIATLLSAGFLSVVTRRRRPAAQ